MEFKNKSRQNKEPLLVNDYCYAFFNLARNDVSKKLQSYYAGPFIVVHRFSDSLYELQPIGNNPVLRNQVIGRDKIRKIVTQTDIMGEKLPFNIHPSPEICPSEEITLEFSHPPEIIENNITKEETNSFSEDEFSYLSYDSNCPHPGDLEEVENNAQNCVSTSDIVYENNSHDNKEGENNMEEQLPTPQVLEKEEERAEQGVSEEKGPMQRVKVPEFLSCSLPTEQSFFTSAPTQSSPQKDIKVSKSNPPAAYLWNESRKLR
ncbi:MAG: hypothetical protein GY739_06510, partial [Mesoflavibacter sp.]|nr:hypothetical protein [Mesoflavibacter sp.]